MNNCIIIYRGPLQRSRLTLLISSYCKIYHKVDFIWLLPNLKYYKKSDFEKFISDFSLDQISVISSEPFRYIQARNRINRFFSNCQYTRAVLVGTTARFFYSKNPLVKIDWFINGIPEEKLLHSKSIAVKLRINLIWFFLNKLAPVDQVIAVSSYMALYWSQK